MEPEQATPFTWHFIDEVARWTLAVSAVGVLIAAGFGYLSFAFAWALLVAIDVGLVFIASHRGRKAAAPEGYERSSLIVFTAVRFGVKAVLLVIAMVVPTVLSFWGAVVGALSYDTVLMVVGSVVAARRTLSSGG